MKDSEGRKYPKVVVLVVIMVSGIISPTHRTKLRRLPVRGDFDRATINEILDEALLCHVGFIVDEQPFVIPTTHARVDDQLFIHGSAASRMLRTLSTAVDICVTVTLMDGLVLARSAFHHSMNYRSVVIFGKATVVTNDHDKLEALRSFSEHVIPGRWREVRPPTEQELKATIVLSLLLNEASAKIRSGSPIDDEADYELDVWAGVIPLRLVAGAPINDPKLKKGVLIPEYVLNYQR